ncbi:MAG: TonB-dependent receptor plug domain-containing protein, partial [Enterobacteriaceae bacterium]
MTITATRTEQKTNEVATTVTIQTQQDIDRNNVNNIHDLIRYEPGISVGGSQSRFGYSGFTIRGIGGNRVLTQVDGVSSAQTFSFGPFMNAQRDYIDLDTVKQVEIIRGPASSLYGSDAIGGAVSFITKEASDYLDEGNDARFRLKTGYDGSNDNWLRSATFAGRYEQFDLLTQFSRTTGRNNESYGTRGGIGEQRTRANPQDLSRDAVLVKLGWALTETQRLQLTYDSYR